MDDAGPTTVAVRPFLCHLSLRCVNNTFQGLFEFTNCFATALGELFGFGFEEDKHQEPHYYCRSLEPFCETELRIVVPGREKIGCRQMRSCVALRKEEWLALSNIYELRYRLAANFYTYGAYLHLAIKHERNRIRGGPIIFI